MTVYEFLVTLALSLVPMEGYLQLAGVMSAAYAKNCHPKGGTRVE